MKFTHDAYTNLIKKLQEKGYIFCNYDNYDLKNKTVILRHDIDLKLEKAIDIVNIENKLGVSAYYFVLLSTDFYNINSFKNIKILNEIRNMGGKIGLHFDETKYNLQTKDDYIEAIKHELKILSIILDEDINVVSMHRPSKKFLEMNLEIPGVINSYQKKFFSEIKYISDSRMYWREDVDRIVENEEYSKLHILTHPFCYDKKEPNCQCERKRKTDET